MSWTLYSNDRVPLLLVQGIYNTWKEDVKAQVFVSKLGARIDKIFCTIQLIFIMDGQLSIIAVVYSRKGKKTMAL